MIVGWARSIEVTYNEDTGTFHPHYHVILILRSRWSEGQLHRTFRKAWNAAARLGYEAITDFRFIEDHSEREDNVPGEDPIDIEGTECREELSEWQLFQDASKIPVDNIRFMKAVLETFKYATKADVLANLPNRVFRQYVRAMQGLRLVSYGGIIKEARKTIGATEDENLEETPREVCDCGQALRACLFRWSFERGMYMQVREALHEIDPAVGDNLFAWVG